MNLLLLENADFVSSTVARVGGRRLRHLLEVHRARSGDRLRVGIVNGRIGSGTIESLSDSGAELRIQLEADPPPALPLTLVIALPRPKVLRRVLQAAATMGIKGIHLVNAWRVEKSFWSSPVLAPDDVREQLLLGLEQGGDTILPEVNEHRLFRPFVEDDLPALARNTLALAAHPRAAEDCPRGVAGPVALAIGPEGGFTDYELDMLQLAGFRLVCLGARVLRVEHALPAFIGRLF